MFWAYYNGIVSPSDLQLATSVEALLMVALGGRGTLVGSVLGARSSSPLKNLVSVYTHRWVLILGAVYIGTIVYAPEGIVGTIRLPKLAIVRESGAASHESALAQCLAHRFFFFFFWG